MPFENLSRKEQGDFFRAFLVEELIPEVHVSFSSFIVMISGKIRLTVGIFSV